MLLDMYLYFGLPLRPSPRRASVSQASNSRSEPAERTVSGPRAASEVRAHEPTAAPRLTVIDGGRAGVP